MIQNETAAGLSNPRPTSEPGKQTLARYEHTLRRLRDAEKALDRRFTIRRSLLLDQALLDHEETCAQIRPAGRVAA
jgi:hypothetical protein